MVTQLPFSFVTGMKVTTRLSEMKARVRSLNKDVRSRICGWLCVHKHMPCTGNENMALRVMTDSLRVPISLIQTTIVLTICCGSHILHIINNREETKNNRTLKTRACG